MQERGSDASINWCCKQPVLGYVFDLTAPMLVSVHCFRLRGVGLLRLFLVVFCSFFCYVSSQPFFKVNSSASFQFILFLLLWFVVLSVINLISPCWF